LVKRLTNPFAMKITLNPRVERHSDGIASVRFQARQPVVVEALSFHSSGAVVLQVKTPLSDRVLWFGLGFLISRELSRDITQIRIQPTLVTPPIHHEVIPADVFAELEVLCAETKTFFTQATAVHWNCAEHECIIRRGNVQWPARQLSIGFDDLVDMIADKEHAAKCA
jgi:hypothetical protein